MAISRLNEIYRHYFLSCSSRWLTWLSAEQKLALLQQATQWHIGEMSPEEYRHWL